MVNDKDRERRVLRSRETDSGPESSDNQSSAKRPAERQNQADTRALELGNTIRVLRDRLPTLLASPLPQDILSPNITLHLFPSTHPHLPTVSGRIPYTGALWTAPVAWGRLPVLGNVKIDILSQRMVCHGGYETSMDASETLIVKWKTCTPVRHGTSSQSAMVDATAGPVDKLTGLLRSQISGKDEPFYGLFIFAFDHKGRIVKHTIEHAEECKDVDWTPRVVSVTDWLLGRAPWNRRRDHVPELALYRLVRQRADRPVDGESDER